MTIDVPVFYSSGSDGYGYISFGPLEAGEAVSTEVYSDVPDAPLTIEALALDFRRDGSLYGIECSNVRDVFPKAASENGEVTALLRRQASSYRLVLDHSERPNLIWLPADESAEGLGLEFDHAGRLVAIAARDDDAYLLPTQVRAAADIPGQWLP